MPNMAAATAVEDMEVFTAVVVASTEAVGTTQGDTTVVLTAVYQKLCTAAAGMGWAGLLQRHTVSTELEVRCLEARAAARL